MVFFGTDTPTHIPDPDNGGGDEYVKVPTIIMIVLWALVLFIVFMIGSVVYSAIPHTLFDKPCAKVWYYSDPTEKKWEFASTRHYFNDEIQKEIRMLPYVKTTFVPTYEGHKEMQVEMLTNEHREETFAQISEILNRYCKE